MKDRWWHHTPQRPGLVLAVAMLAALAASAGITAILTAGGGTHRPLAAGAGLGAGIPVPSSGIAPAGTGPASMGPPSTGPAPSGSRAATARPSPRASAPAGASSPAASPGQQTPTAPPPTAPGLPSPTPTGSPAQGHLRLAPDHLMLTSKPGQPASGFFVLTAANGPVAQYTVRVAARAAKISVAPVSGSLALNGFVEVTVTVTSKVALTTQIVVEPGNLSVTVVYKPKAPPAPRPSPSHGKGEDGDGNGDG
jgi:hypothetical protein